jgi:phage terminase small subunit
MALTEKRRRFVEEYLKDLNGKQAAIRAGYAPGSAEVEASRLLKDAKVRSALEAATRERTRRVEGHGITVDRIVLELAKIGFSDIRKVVEWHGAEITDEKDGDEGEGGDPVVVIRAANFVKLIGSGEIDDATAAAIAEISQTRDGALKVKMHNKQSALVNLLRHLTAPRQKPAEDDEGEAQTGRKTTGDSWDGLLQ